MLPPEGGGGVRIQGKIFECVASRYVDAARNIMCDDRQIAVTVAPRRAATMTKTVQSWTSILKSYNTMEEGMHLLHKENISDATVLPHPPTDAEMMSYVDSKRFFITAFGVMSCLPLCTGLWLFVWVEPWFAPMALLITSYLMISYFGVGVWGRDMKYADHEAVLARERTHTPTVDVFLPCCGEPVEVLANTFKHVTALDWDRTRLRVHVLDDGPRPHSIRALALEHGFEYIRRPDVGVLKKAGNLRHAFRETDGELILILDADFAPRPDFLRHTTPYFEAPDVCIVQTPQYFSVLPSQTWVERAAGSIQELFYRLVQQNRQAFDATICVGSCAVYRRAALEPLGGTAAVAASEDVHTSYMLTDAGWRVQYLPLPLSKGTCPDTKKAYFMQNYRWCTGSLLLTTSREFWMSRLTPMQKVCYATGGAYYISTGLSIFANAVPSIMLTFTRPHLVLWYNGLFALPSLLFPFCAMRIWNTQHYGFESVRVRWLQYSAHLVAIFDKLTGDHMVWVPTGAAGGTKNKRYNTAMAILLHVTVAQMLLLYSGTAWRITQGYPWHNFLPSILVETFNVLICFQVFYK
jgi:cellulose synthase/poly-beta-1,6-N-acetylglucosamine synthase-like glycosyltransferase